MNSVRACPQAKLKPVYAPSQPAGAQPSLTTPPSCSRAVALASLFSGSPPRLPRVLLQAPRVLLFFGNRGYIGGRSGVGWRAGIAFDWGSKDWLKTEFLGQDRAGRYLG